MHPVLLQIGWLTVPSYGACAALGVLLALGLAQATARCTGLDPRHAWNMLVLSVFASLAISRLVLIALNWSDLRRHPRWLLAVALVHHPLLAAIGIAGAAAAAAGYALWAGIPLRLAADSLAAPVALGAAAEQLGALMAGSGFGRESAGAWAVVYTSPLAARWSGTPLDLPLYPVQAFASVGWLLLAGLLCAGIVLPRRPGDLAGAWTIGAGILVFVSEGFRDWEGRGVLPGGYADLPQLVALGMVLLGGALLCDWRPPGLSTTEPSQRS